MSTTAASRDRPSPSLQTEARSWQSALRTAIRDPIQLCRTVQLSPSYHRPAVQAAATFPVFAPLDFVGKMRRGDPNDPLLRQVLPLGDEVHEISGFTSDPVGDRNAIVRPGVIQKYHSRVLLVTTGACPVHCRYCFRRQFPYQESPRSFESWLPALHEIASDPTIEEVILSGGDPLTQVDSELARLSQSLSRIGHLRRVRIHTRFPVMVPQRVDDALLKWLAETSLTVVVVVHVNHPTELDSSVERAMAQLIGAGASLLNQSVLLRGVNDDVDTLAELSQRLVDLRIMPYYLHQLDRVSGAAHFEVPIAVGKNLIRQLKARLPGYAVPRYVREDAGEPSKTSLI